MRIETSGVRNVSVMGERVFSDLLMRVCVL